MRHKSDDKPTLKAPSQIKPSGNAGEFRQNFAFLNIVVFFLPEEVDINIPPYEGTLAENIVGKQWVESAVSPGHDVYAELGQKLAARCNEANAQQVSLYGFEYRTADDDDSKPYYVVLYFEV